MMEDTCLVGVPMTEEEIKQVRDAMRINGNIVSAKKYGNTKSIIVDGSMAKTKEERRMALDKVASVISKYTSGWECHIKDLVFD